MRSPNIPPLVEVIVPTYNNLARLRKTLEALELQTYRDFEVFVCVDGSTDGTFEWLERAEMNFPLRVLHHPGKVNRGRNATRNLALPYLRGRYLALIDSDLVPVPQWLDAHKRMLDRFEGWCASGGLMNFTDAPRNRWAAYYMTRGRAKYSHGQETPYQYFTTGNIALPTQCFTELGGQDPEMRTYGGGDTEFAYRLHKAFRLPVIQNEEAAASGRMEKSLNKVWRQMEEMGALNLRHIRRKHPEFTKVYRTDLLLGRSTRARLFQLLLSAPVCAVVNALLPISSGALQRRMIHYKVLYHLRKGYFHGAAKGLSSASEQAQNTASPPNTTAKQGTTPQPASNLPA